MARILALSSQVVSGHVGLSAIVPALQLLGHEVLALPTILLSNHPGRQPTSGTRIEPDVLIKMLDRLASNGRLDNIDGVLTGYLPSAAHVGAAMRAIDLCSTNDRKPLYLCDPVIGDDPKGIYIDLAAAAAIRDQLLPRADIVTPNRFELAWLSGLPVDDLTTATAAAHALSRPLVLATSVPATAHTLITAAISATAVSVAEVPKRAIVPNGTGDLMAALFLAANLAGDGMMASILAQTVACVDLVIAASAGNDELQLVAAKKDWAMKDWAMKKMTGS